MRLEHVAVWTRDLEGLREFYCRWFGAVAGEKYVNTGKGFESYLLALPGGGRIELMRKPGLADRGAETWGVAHFALSAGSEAAVDEAAGRMREAGIKVLDGPRRTGDGCYECAIEDPEGNRVEITV